MLGVVCLAFVPYAIFHLLLQETATIRYALPLVPPIVWLATLAMSAGASLVASVGSRRRVGRDRVGPDGDRLRAAGAPAFRAIVDMISEGEGSPPAGVYSHYALYRSLQAAAPDWLHPGAAGAPEGMARPVEFFRDGGERDRVVPRRSAAHRHGAVRSGHVLTNEPNPWRAAATRRWAGVAVGRVWHRISRRLDGGRGWSLTPEAGGRVRASGPGSTTGRSRRSSGAVRSRPRS
jgi:hypothetical protein